MSKVINMKVNWIRYITISSLLLYRQKNNNNKTGKKLYQLKIEEKSLFKQKDVIIHNSNIDIDKVLKKYGFLLRLFLCQLYNGFIDRDNKGT